MIEDCRKLLACVNVFAPHFNPFHLDHLVSFASLNLYWSDEKVYFVMDALVAQNIITIENNIITINKGDKLYESIGKNK